MREYANIQLLLDDRVEAARERIIYTVTAYMEAQGFVPCGRESAERTVAFARVKNGWSIFDDCADRLDIHALHGLARCLTARLRTRAVAIMGLKNGFILKLYCDGVLQDTFSTQPRSFFKTRTTGRVACPGHAVRWHSILRKDVSLRELSSAFLQARENPDEGFERLQHLLCLDETAKFGFASIEDSKLQGVVELYFHTANRVRQHWYDRFIRIPARCGNAVVSALFRKKRCRQRH